MNLNLCLYSNVAYLLQQTKSSIKLTVRYVYEKRCPISLLHLQKILGERLTVKMLQRDGIMFVAAFTRCALKLSFSYIITNLFFLDYLRKQSAKV